LDASLQQLKESNARVDQRISDLKEFIAVQKHVPEKQSHDERLVKYLNINYGG